MHVSYRTLLIGFLVILLGSYIIPAAQVARFSLEDLINHSQFIVHRRVHWNPSASPLSNSASATRYKLPGSRSMTRAAAIVLFTVSTAFSYVRSVADNGTPIFRPDAANIRFLVNLSVKAGARNADG